MTENGTMQITPAEGWRRREEKVRLPSGKVAMMKKPDVVDVIMGDGTIPDALAGFMMSTAVGEIDENQISAKELPGMMELANKLCVATFVEPRVVTGDPDYDSGEIAIGDIDMVDRMFVVSWAQGRGTGGEAEKLAQFLAEQDAGI